MGLTHWIKVQFYIQKPFQNSVKQTTNSCLKRVWKLLTLSTRGYFYSVFSEKSLHTYGCFLLIFLKTCSRMYGMWSESCSVVSDSCDPMDYTVHGILQPRILEWVAFPFSRESSQPRDRSQVSRIAGRFFTPWATRDIMAFKKYSIILPNSKVNNYSSKS